MMKRIYPFILSACIVAAGCSPSRKKEVAADGAPRIVNIINFIRQLEPRNSQASGAGGEARDVMEDELYQTVVEQVRLLKKHGLPGTFLLQYDALINPKYQELLKGEPSFEAGAWWEITQPHVEAAGMTWRGRYPWDWHANVGFATGYTPEEREKLADVYMEKFKSIFGKYPASVGSWFIDAHTLGYLSDKYGIVASCNCKDQVGTDGYTLWGGYWNQAYYPSRKNAYMPAQTAEGQIPVPIFRMLGSDPIYQYKLNGIITLEPVYTNMKAGGGVREWVEWFFRTMMNEPCLAYNYIQAGQENSFTWAAMQKGLEMQIPMLDSLRKAGKARVETLEESGRWFREKYPLTPATAVTATTDHRNQGRKSVWYNSRFYRANLLWEGASFRFRDVHMFDELFESDYLTKAGTSTECIYKTLPVVDGYFWSSDSCKAGLYITGEDGSPQETTAAPEISELPGNVLQVTVRTLSGQEFKLLFYEDRFEVTSSKAGGWALTLNVAPDADLPFRLVTGSIITAGFDEFIYMITCRKGTFEPSGDSSFRIRPDESGTVVVDCGER